jgi:hypothetical protein
LEKKKSGEKTVLEMKIPAAPFGQPTSVKDSPESLKGVPGQGRPKNSKDSSKRKEKKFSPQTGATLQLWADSAQDNISEIINPILLDFYKKKNMRSLSSIQYLEAEETRSKILFSASPFDKIDQDFIQKSFATINNNNVNKIFDQYSYFLTNIKKSFARELTVNELKQVKSYFYSMVYENLHN